MEIPLKGKKVLVLGSGGASVTTVIVLKELGANVSVISRTGENNYSNLHLRKDAAMIVNTTPVGMYPNAGVSPVDLDVFPHLEGVLDIIYNPARTKLLLDAAVRKIPCENGLWMLIAQAKEAAEWFTGTRISNNVIVEVYAKMCNRIENIILFGMPGCGKSTIGKFLASETNREFVDADAEIVRKAGMSIPAIFETQGEAEFRKIETEVLAELGQKSALVIATCGGCVTQPQNEHLLRQNGTVYWIQRDISSLPTDGRPLSQSVRLEEMYRIRKPLYAHFADCIISNNRTVEEAVNLILKGRAKQ
jgi:shikimate dehydrogenase